MSYLGILFTCKTHCLFHKPQIKCFKTMYLDFLFQKDRKHVFFPISLLLSTVKTPEHYMQDKHEIRRLGKVERGRETNQGLQDLSNDTAVNSLGFLFATYTLDWGLEMLAIQKHQWTQTKKAPRKDCSLHSQRTRKRIAEQDRKFFKKPKPQKTLQSYPSTSKG